MGEALINKIEKERKKERPSNTPKTTTKQYKQMTLLALDLSFIFPPLGQTSLTRSVCSSSSSVLLLKASFLFNQIYYCLCISHHHPPSLFITLPSPPRRGIPVISLDLCWLQGGVAFPLSPSLSKNIWVCLKAVNFVVSKTTNFGYFPM